MRTLFLTYLLFSGLNVQAAELNFLKAARVVKRNECYYLVLNIQNHSDRPMYFEPGDPLMDLVDQRGRKMKEIGIIANFGELKPEDYDVVASGNNQVKIISLNNKFKFGIKGRYKVILSGGYYDPLHNVLYPRPELVVRFVYSGGKVVCDELESTAFP